MGRKSKNSPPVEPRQENETYNSSGFTEETTGSVSSPAPSAFVDRSQSQPDGPKKERLSFNVSNSGQIDWESLHGKNKSKLMEVLKADPEVMRLAGKSVEEELQFAFTAKDAKVALGMLNKANAFATRLILARKGLALDSDILEMAFSSSKDEDELAERGARLANRYSTDWMKKHADLVLFIGLYFKSVTAQTMAAIEAQVARNNAIEERKARQARPNGHSVPEKPIDLMTDIPR